MEERIKPAIRGFFCKTDGGHRLLLVWREVIPRPGLDDVRPQHVPRGGVVLEPGPCRVPDCVVDSLPISEAEVQPLHWMLPREGFVRVPCPVEVAKLGRGITLVVARLVPVHPVARGRILILVPPV
jgi:hypothetical protein